MKNIALAFALAVVLVPAAPAQAQLGGILNKAQKAKEKVDKVDAMIISEADERKIGEGVSAALIDRFGVYQDAAVTKYVSLVGSVLAQAGTRPNLKWEFIVLDTDGVNAYAAPGGLIHITRGALGLMKNESELAGVLGHEIGHVTAEHTKEAIQKAKWAGAGADAAGDRAGGFTGQMLEAAIGQAYTDLFENKFDRNEEMESDKIGIALANKVGYAPTGMNAVLAKIADRNKDMKEQNGLFASHPQIRERISAMDKQIKKDKLNATALVAARYTGAITFDVKPAATVAMLTPGAKGLAGESAPAKDAKKDEAKPAKKGGVLGTGFLSKGSQAQNEGTIASAGSRGGIPDRDAVGGSNKNKVRVSLTAAEIATFKKGIA
jgi:predicted Zn-dependent protease